MHIFIPAETYAFPMKTESMQFPEVGIEVITLCGSRISSLINLPIMITERKCPINFRWDKTAI